MNQQETSRSPRELATAQYNIARSNLIAMIGLTLLNVVLLFLDSSSMMLFSATVPYFTMAIGIATDIQALTVACCIFAAVIVIAYFICWLCSKQHYGWMVAALVMFSLDTLALIAIYLLAGDFSGILDLLIHVLVLYYLIKGVKYGAQLKKLPEEPQFPEEGAPAEQL